MAAKKKVQRGRKHRYKRGSSAKPVAAPAGVSKADLELSEWKSQARTWMQGWLSDFRAACDTKVTELKEASKRTREIIALIAEIAFGYAGKAFDEAIGKLIENTVKVALDEFKNTSEVSSAEDYLKSLKETAKQWVTTVQTDVIANLTLDTLKSMDKIATIPDRYFEEQIDDLVREFKEQVEPIDSVTYMCQIPSRDGRGRHALLRHYAGESPPPVHQQTFVSWIGPRMEPLARALTLSETQKGEIEQHDPDDVGQLP